MSVPAARMLGWPSYPNFPSRPPLTPQKLRKQSPAASLLHQNLSAIEREPNFRELAGEQVRRMLLSPHPLKAADDVLLATRLFWAERIGEELEILKSRELMALAVKIETIAGQLVDQLLVGDVQAYTFAWYGYAAITNELARLFAGELSEVLKYLKISELNEMDLIQRLRADPAEREKFIAERQKYELPPETRTLIDQYSNCLSQLKKSLEPIRRSFLFHVVDSAFNEGFATEELRAMALERYNNELGEIVLFINHDIAHCFAGFLTSPGPIWEHKSFVPSLPSFSRLPDHLKHLINVLEVNKYRLDGLSLSQEKVHIAEVIKTALCAVGHRWGQTIRLNLGGAARPGLVNFICEADVEVELAPAFLELMAYNPVKNSIKAVVEAKRDLKEMFITVKVKQDGGAALVTVEDNGMGFNLNRLLKAALDEAKKSKNQSLIGNPTFKKLLRWDSNPNVYRTFTLGEVLDLTFIATLSGFQDQSVSSGLGLNEVAEFCRLIGADVLLTNKADGGAMVSFIIGEKSEREAIIARELGTS